MTGAIAGNVIGSVYEGKKAWPHARTPAMRASLESTDYESAVRLAISLCGDCDTLACIAGGIAEAYYGGVPEDIRQQAWERLDNQLRKVVEEFEQRYPLGGTAS
jgi:ADP-ribosylglycohydrolase